MIIQDIEIAHPYAFIVIDGDFNHCTLKKSSVHYYQHVDCPTRGNATLDLCYSNVKEAYKASPLTPLGGYDHDLVILYPSYLPIVQRQRPHTVTTQQWNCPARDQLQSILDTTDWDMFIESTNGIDELTETISSYVNFCVDCSVPTNRQKTIPALWKQSCIIPVPKKANITCMIDLRPVALTSVAMKSCERIVLRYMKPLVSEHLDPLQFAYRAKRNTEDAILYCLEKVYSHLEKSNAGHSARITFFDFSSAFNMIQPHVLVHKLLNMNVPHNLVTWLFNYLTNRSQYVRINQSNCVSNTLVSSTGAPQETVLAPFLFTVYTSDARSSHDSCHLIKFADDTALVGLITRDDGGEYLSQINWFVDYCDQNFLELNMEKTKEMVIDLRKGDHEPPPVCYQRPGCKPCLVL
ncbi:putative RNA-directed DNA polymerase from mobile element jockey-like [Apostichopus japonicus]|uniref:Putative RNA-directed DNA polymerase from mobile element jockey-like n=1 Tax=Stichopus japonicus TaxID=307972 RepID=A0A2G8L6C1_STIJA|nr:putative RNA-directed DNA polymerase from mobile element jockey-like [Apostichopus japonicus]